MAKCKIVATLTLEYEFEPGKTQGWDYLVDETSAEEYLAADIAGFNPEDGGDITQLIDDPRTVVEVNGEILDV